jgi:hypothetical protein
MSVFLAKSAHLASLQKLRSGFSCAIARKEDMQPLLHSCRLSLNLRLIRFLSEQLLRSADTGASTLLFETAQNADYNFMAICPSPRPNHRRNAVTCGILTERIDLDSRAISC